MVTEQTGVHEGVKVSLVHGVARMSLLVYTHLMSVKLPATTRECLSLAVLTSRARLAQTGRVLDELAFADYLLRKVQGKTGQQPAVRALPAH